MMNKCLKCGYEWEGKPDAKSCPRCKRYDWNSENKNDADATNSAPKGGKHGK